MSVILALLWPISQDPFENRETMMLFRAFRDTSRAFRDSISL